MSRGDIPVKRDGKFLLVPRGVWDEKLKRLRQQLREAGQRRRPSGRKIAAKPAVRKAAAKAVETTDA